MDQMSESGKKKQSVPFSKLFQAVSPKEFVTLFDFELPQTKAFILSFSPRKSYVRKVMRLLDAQEPNEMDSTNKFSFIIREYLNRCQENTFNINFVHAVEKEVESMIAGYENIHDLCSLRKKFFKHPEKYKLLRKKNLT
jgi:flagellar motor switch protein FliG